MSKVQLSGISCGLRPCAQTVGTGQLGHDNFFIYVPILLPLSPTVPLTQMEHFGWAIGHIVLIVLYH